LIRTKEKTNDLICKKKKYRNKEGISVEKEEKETLFVKEGKEIFAEWSVYLCRKGGKKQQ